MPIDFLFKYNEYCDMCNQREFLPYEMPPQVNFTNTFHLIALAADSEEKYNCIVSKNPLKMDKTSPNTFRVKLSKMFDAYGNRLQINMYPNETIEKVELKISDDVVEKIENPNGLNFCFIKSKYFTVQYWDITIDITYGLVQYDHDRIAWIDAISYCQEKRVEFCRIAAKIYDGSNRPIEDTEQEKAVKKTLKQMKICPTCRTPAVLTCNSVSRDSECVNGHCWYYDLKNNRIITGKKKHQETLHDSAIWN